MQSSSFPGAAANFTLRPTSFPPLACAEPLLSSGNYIQRFVLYCCHSLFITCQEELKAKACSLNNEIGEPFADCSFLQKNLAELLDAKREIDNVARKKRSVPVHLDMNINDNLTAEL